MSLQSTINGNKWNENNKHVALIHISDFFSLLSSMYLYLDSCTIAGQPNEVRPRSHHNFHAFQSKFSFYDNMSSD